MIEPRDTTTTPAGGDGLGDEVTADAIPVTVSVVEAHLGPELEVRYDGRRPPLELFGIWTDLGWSAPHVPGPPRDAIDWSTPDPVAGTRHTIRSFPAEGRATRTGPSLGGRHLAGAIAAARRLGYAVLECGDEPAASTRPDAEPPIDERATSGDATEPTPARGGTRIVTVVPPHASPSLVAMAEDRGARVTTADATLSKVVTYRGSRNVTEVPAVRVVIDLDDEGSDDLLAAVAAVSPEPPRVERSTD